MGDNSMKVLVGKIWFKHTTHVECKRQKFDNWLLTIDNFAVHFIDEVKNQLLGKNTDILAISHLTHLTFT